MKLPCPLNSSITIQLRIPYDNIEQYETQLPLELLSTVVWYKPVDDGHHYGVKFNEFMSTETAQKLKACFAFFNQAATY
jgi:methyl-accepting chemotaxis protein